MFLSELLELLSAPCLTGGGGRRTWWLLASRCCWYRMRPWYAPELVCFLVGLRTYQHPGNVSDFNETCIFSTGFEKHSNIKFHENPADGSRVASCGQSAPPPLQKKMSCSAPSPLPNALSNSSFRQVIGKIRSVMGKVNSSSALQSTGVLIGP